ncbi:MAG TPA: hypothetical protein ENN20_03300 [Candidatus Marinimicrobia bacterium]|nr:hypothetical protein [Candidatus Neomarinimicrobiota bacterium]
MQPITINLLGNAKLLKKQKRIKFFFSSTYIFLWLFSAFTLYHIYRTNLYISSIYLKEIHKIKTEINRQSPVFERIRILNQQNRQIINERDEYQQTLHRPSLWLSKMLLLSELTPPDIRLNKLQVRTYNSGKKKNELIHIRGITNINSGNPNNDLLNTYKQSLENNSDFMVCLEKVSILETRIETNNNKPVMAFTMSIY